MFIVPQPRYSGYCRRQNTTCVTFERQQIAFWPRALVPKDSVKAPIVSRIWPTDCHCRRQSPLRGRGRAVWPRRRQGLRNQLQGRFAGGAAQRARQPDGHVLDRMKTYRGHAARGGAGTTPAAGPGRSGTADMAAGNAFVTKSDPIGRSTPRPPPPPPTSILGKTRKAPPQSHM